MATLLEECHMCVHKGPNCILCFPDDSVAFYDSEEAFLADMYTNAEQYRQLEEALQITAAVVDTIETLMKDLQKKPGSLE